jgi:hypothetical protein
MEKFTLQHVVLYSKYWYERTDLLSDIKKCLSADDYSGECFRMVDCARVIMHQFSLLDTNRNILEEFVFAIQDENIWKCGYYTKTNSPWYIVKDLPDYDVNEAIIRYCLSCFSMLRNDQWNRCKPDFNILNISVHLTQLAVDERFNDMKII